MTAIELSILDWLQTARCGFLDAVMPIITTLGDSGIIWILLTLVLLCIPRYRRTGLTMACALALDVVCCNLLLKPLVARVRPFDANPLVELIVGRPTDWSFPSGHTAASFASTAALYASGEPLWIPAAVLSVLIAFSRLYLYVHYPTDVLAGLVLGTVLGVLGRKLFLFLERKVGRKAS